MADAATPGEVGDTLRAVAEQEPQGLDLTGRSSLSLLDGARQIPNGSSEPIGGLEGECDHGINVQDGCTDMQANCIVLIMEFIKHVHATVALSKDQHSVVIDPGAYTPNSAELVGEASAVLVTHDHPDHFDAAILDAALDSQRDLQVWAPASVVAALGEHEGRVHTVTAGDVIAVAGFDILVVGERHAPIHRDVPPMDNVGYVVDGSVYHPGDSYVVPEAAVDLLLLPTSGPWAKLDDAVDFVRAVSPGRIVQVHDIMLSDIGRQALAQFIDQLTGRTVETLAPGSSITV
jgi:L-ascorbate metabolism protein UlaG (beta-lactamase superfamily)